MHQSLRCQSPTAILFFVHEFSSVALEFSVYLMLTINSKSFYPSLPDAGSYRCQTPQPAEDESLNVNRFSHWSENKMRYLWNLELPLFLHFSVCLFLRQGFVCPSWPWSLYVASVDFNFSSSCSHHSVLRLQAGMHHPSQFIWCWELNSWLLKY